MKSKRIGHIDGLRGVAILAVIGYHTFTRWPEWVPWGDSYSALFTYGWAGVQLFFIISGYVILMTLDRSAGLLDFAWRRWLRLWPAMAVCSAAIFAASFALPHRPEGTPTLGSLLPGLMFIDPYIWSLLGVSAPVLEGSFWSIYVEVIFYAMAGPLYLLGGRIGVIAGCVAMFLLSLAGNNWVANTAGHFIWFAAGACLYVWRSGGGRWWLAGGLIACAAGSLRLDGWGVVAGMVASALFVVPLVSGVIARILSTRALIFVGGISYPLYLLHQNLLISLIDAAGIEWQWLSLAGSFVVVLALAWTIQRSDDWTRRILIERTTARRPGPSHEAAVR